MDCIKIRSRERKPSNEKRQELLLERLAHGQKSLRKIRWQISGSVAVLGWLLAAAVMAWLLIDAQQEDRFHRIPLTIGWSLCIVGMVCIVSAPLPDDQKLTRLSILGMTMLCLTFTVFEGISLWRTVDRECENGWQCREVQAKCTWFLCIGVWNVVWNLIAFFAFMRAACLYNPEAMQRRLWKFWAIYFRVSVAVDIVVVCVDWAWALHHFGTASIFIVGDSLGMLFSFFPQIRHRLHAVLHRYFKATERTAAAAGVASLIGNCDVHIALQQAEARFRVINVDQLQKDDLSDNRPSPQLFHLSRPAVLGNCDAFVSHSWRDNADAKWDALQRWSRTFNNQFGRPPSVWLDKACINQQDIEANLRSLPIFLSGCQTLLILCGTTYLSRLWCILELFTFVHMGGKPCDIDCILTVGQDQADAAAIGSLCRNFDANHCDCSEASDKEKILTIIHTAFGTMESFNADIRKTMRRIAGLSTDRFALLSPGPGSSDSDDDSDLSSFTSLSSQSSD
mmetsp:Transcript_8850/g.20490  ORF Transcript_8850/g.20490 Transcript_8850/m.20490 type:complete len:509 (-) Transcript_8850:5-1531(-)